MPAKNKSCFPYASGLTLKLMSFEVPYAFFLLLANNMRKMCPGLHLGNKHTLFSTSAECLLTMSLCYSGLAAAFPVQSSCYKYILCGFSQILEWILYV